MSKRKNFLKKRELKRKQTIRRFMIYGIIGLAVFITTATIVMLTEGYYFDLNGRHLIKNGLVFVDSAPQGATVTINDVQQKDRTESRFTLPEGKYDVKVSKDNYREWKRSFSLGGSEVVNLNYVLLVPNQIPKKTIGALKNDLILASQSPDRKWIATYSPSDGENFFLIDTSKKEMISSQLVVPVSIIPESERSSLKEVQWSNDNQHLLLESSPGQAQYFVLNRTNPAESLNLNKVFGMQLKDLTLKDNKFDKYYALDENHGLRQLDYSNKTISAPIFEKVISYKSYGNDILMTAIESKDNNNAEIWLSSKDGKVLIATIKKQPKEDITLNLAEYDGDWYLVFSSMKDNVAKVYRNTFDYIKNPSPSQPKPLANLDMTSPGNPTFSANTRFISIQSGSNFVVFDNEYERTYRYTLDLTPDEGTKAKWIDGHRMTIKSSKMNYIFDYDGINKQELSPSVALTRLFFDRDYEQFFSLEQDETSANIQFKQNTLDLDTL